MELAVGTEAFGFEVAEADPLPEIDGRAYVLRHRRSGARLLYLANDDPNKVFSIAFKTPPADNTGVFHILEHSVLCGSRKFPVKEPFVNLLKSSMQTFLNAMTGPDFTIYPVASINEQDLMNLMDVYMDAVIYPDIYRKPEIFRQEGWHLETLDDEGGCGGLAYNGVVLNEMKGALSDPVSALLNVLDRGMYPDTAYGFESGGEPDDITALDYEDFLDAHSRHYRLDNSYLLLYGNMDADRFLRFLDEEYLSPAADLHKDAGEPNPHEIQAPVVNLGLRREMACGQDNACAGIAFATGVSVRDTLQLAASEILLEALCGSNEAPLMRAVLDADLADDMLAFQAGGQRQPYAALLLRGVHVDNPLEKLQGTVQGCVRDLVENGIDRDLIEAAISRTEFQTRECDFGSYPDGVIYAMNCLQTWFFDEEGATTCLRYEKIFADLREFARGDGFELLCRRIFLENDHMASAEIVPVEAEDANAEARRLAKIAGTIGETGIEEVRRSACALREAQERPDAPEDVAKLPHLGVADIDEPPAPGSARIEQHGGTRLLRTDIASRGICYVNRYYSLNCLEFDELPYAVVLGSVLGKLDTRKHSAAQIAIMSESLLGSLSFHISNFSEYGGSGLYPKLCVAASVLESKVEAAADLPGEIMFSTRFLDEDGMPLPEAKAKVREVLAQIKTAMQQHFANSGHTLAANNAACSYSRSAVLARQMTGVDYYRFLKELLRSYEQRADDLLSKLDGLRTRIFLKGECLTSFTGSDEALGRYLAAQDASVGRADGSAPALLEVPDPVPGNRAFVIPGEGCYAAVCYNRRKLGSQDSGAWRVASRILSYDYLWNEVRVKGGAYGTGFITGLDGNARFYSYRDPKLDATLQRFADASAWLESFMPDDGELEGYIVSVVAAIDAPSKPRAQVSRLENWYFSKFDSAIYLQRRREAMEVDAEQLHDAARTIADIVKKDCRCAVGSRDIIEASELDWEIDDVLMG